MPIAAPTAGSWTGCARWLALIDRAIAQGVAVAADQYPYLATSTDLSALLPRWVHEGGPEATLERLRDPETSARIHEEMSARGGIARYGVTYDRVVITQAQPESNRWTEGLSVVQVAQRWGVGEVEAVLRLLREADLAVGMCNFLMCEEDVERVMRHPRVCIGSDSIAKCRHGPLGQGKPHPRAYGAFPRVLGHYSRERGVLTLEEAVHKMTGLPAALLGLSDRGLLREGMAADITLFDPDRVSDRATYQDPRRPAEGIETVLVNGQAVLDQGRITGVLPGRVLHR